MRLVDVNVLVDAHRIEAPRHDRVRSWLTAALRSREPLGIPSVVASGFLRVVTHPRVFVEPTPTPIALAVLDAVLASPSATIVHPGARHWSIFRELTESIAARGNDVPDVYLAALAIEERATWVTSDHGFERFPDLRIQYPAA